ncbi:amidohydrolase [Pseudoflavonifractor phocaeensis]|uniref:amidohydrolase n=1 Tax=Pseudoflavonifractor phocaeensis TaxID=1870988 RepID=UPI001F2FD488|nr:amidohydrolase [Pseudoflavonifractor phocaeensis]MCF2660777.1 amidohydrolase [Pseudoflavonifractor phocaeensis]
MDHMEEKILSIIDAHADELQALADDIFHHAEQGYHEYRTAQLVADYLKKLGLKTREGLAITGVKAAIGKGTGPNVALIGELDAVSCPTHPDASDKGYAHACGHYAQITCMLGAALALSDPEVAASLDGTATIFAVPAEEFQDASVREEVRRTHDVHCAGGKCELLRRGEFDDVDLAVTTHSLMVGREEGIDLMLGNSACTGFIGKTVYMHGRAAHAAAAPHLGANALNAACLGMSALGMVRETFEEKDCVRVHPYIRKGGEAINVVPSEVIVDMMVRANTQEAIEKVSAKVDNCFKGAAMAIGCQAEIVDCQGYMPCPERLPEDILWDTAKLLGDQVKVASIPAGRCNTASTDVGDLFAVMPVLNFTFGGSTGDLHSKDYKVSDPNAAHILPAKMMALLAYRLLKNGAAEARKIVDGYQAPYTMEQYKDYVKKMSD